MSIAYDTAPPPGKGTRRSGSSPSLLNRIEKPPLLDRLSKTDTKSKPAPAPYVSSRMFRKRLCSQRHTLHLIRQGGVGPVRTKARGGAASARAPARKEREKPKTAEELDQELDAFMKDEITAAFSCQALVSR